MSFFILISVLFFALRRKQKYYLLLSGLSIGLAMLTKYPGVLPVFILGSFVIFMDRRLLKEKNFWIAGILSFVIFLPWLIWNWRVYGNLSDVFISAHNLDKHWENAKGVLFGNTIFLLFVPALAALFLILRRKISSFLGIGMTVQITLKRKRIVGAAGFLIFVIAIIFVPFLRAMMKEAFVWKNEVLVGWSNPFKAGPWHFYFTRLGELSPLYIFSFLSFLLFAGKNKGDKLLVWSSIWILIAFILLGNYQSRYILPAVPFLIILSARFQILMYDKLSLKQNNDKRDVLARIFKIGLFAIGLYFVIKTLRTDWLIAIGPDYGYF